MAQFDVREFKHVEIISELIKKSGKHIYTGFTFNNILLWPNNFNIKNLLGSKNNFLGLLHKKIFDKDIPRYISLPDKY